MKLLFKQRFFSWFDSYDIYDEAGSTVYVVRGQLSCNFIKDRNNLPLPLAFLLTNLLTNFLTNPDFVAYKLEDRNGLSFRLCRKLWGVKEFNWTIRREEDADAAVRDDRGVIFEGFLPQ